jgi:glycosyltransferase involved in cell wall biosynthesis
MSATCSVFISTILQPSLKKTIDSVLPQGLAPGELEIIVVKDTGQIPEGAGRQDTECIRLITTKRVKLSAARNAGAALARNDYLAFMDDNDWFLPRGTATPA